MQELTPEQRLDLPCIVCGRTLENATRMPDGTGLNYNQPSEGLAFRSHGAYGSTAFDPMDGHYLEINICDTCLLIAMGKQIVAIGKDHRLVRDKDDPRVIIGDERLKPEEMPPLRVWEGLSDPSEDDEDAVYR